MVTYRGFKTFVQFDEETAYGTGATPATAIQGRIQSVTINQSNNLIRTCGLGEGRNETFVGWGNFEGTWSMEYDIASFSFLQFLVGAQGGSGTAAAPYYLEEKDYVDYTAGGQYGIKSFGMQIGTEDGAGVDDVDTLSGCIINTCGLTLNVGEALKCTLEGFYRTIASSTSATAFTPNTTKPWIFSQGTFNWNGAPVARITSATININNNYDPEVGRQIGSRFVEAAEPGLRKYDWTITVKMTDTIATTLRNHFYGQVNSMHSGIKRSEPTFYALVFALSEGVASGDRNAQILLTDCAINDISKPINIGENIIELTINGTAKTGTPDTVNKPIKWWTV